MDPYTPRPRGRCELCRGIGHPPLTREADRAPQELLAVPPLHQRSGLAERIDRMTRPRIWIKRTPRPLTGRLSGAAGVASATRGSAPRPGPLPPPGPRSPQPILGAAGNPSPFTTNAIGRWTRAWPEPIEVSSP